MWEKHFYLNWNSLSLWQWISLQIFDKFILLVVAEIYKHENENKIRLFDVAENKNY